MLFACGRRLVHSNHLREGREHRRAIIQVEKLGPSRREILQPCRPHKRRHLFELLLTRSWLGVPRTADSNWGAVRRSWTEVGVADEASLTRMAAAIAARVHEYPPVDISFTAR